MKHSNRVKVQRLLRILKVRCILLLHDYRAGLPDQNKLWFRHTLSFDDVRQPNSAIWRKIRNEYIFLLKCDMARTRIQNSDFNMFAQINYFWSVFGIPGIVLLTVFHLYQWYASVLTWLKFLVAPLSFVAIKRQYTRETW